ncbi:helix-turn-helix domain-containing protein [Sphingobacterium luzhongxinii]|uniref:helix-turn-helix domain-containing protein n=1 Tax=Sphingobacterium luzhongxinii TaxID=2654181 RepID=UPI0013DC6EF9|nr:AraC family transcriptional regulator [Sphingobacterium sp. xlx-73]
MSFVKFLNENSALRQASRYDGYLSFIPETHCSITDKQPAHRYLYNDNFYWLEVKDSIQLSPQQLEIHTNMQDCLWIHMDLSGRSVLLTSPPRPLSTGEIQCYKQSIAPLSVQLNDGKNWVFMIGILPANMERLAAEYPAIRTWLNMDHTGKECTVLGKMTLHPKLFSVLDALKRISFRPFGTYYLLMAWNLRIFDIVFNEAKEETDTEQDHEVRLYHKTITYLRQHFCEEGLTLQRIAESLNVSVRTLTRSFANRPHSVSAYLQELRLVEARDRIMASDNTIVSIAFSLHFACQKSFSKLFKKRFGYTPTEWREKMIRKRSLVN